MADESPKSKAMRQRNMYIVMRMRELLDELAKLKAERTKITNELTAAAKKK